MAREIERKFLPQNDTWRRLIQYTQQIHQGYLVLPDHRHKPSSVKSSVRIRAIDKQAFITVKSLELGISREEFEYPIAYQEAQSMLENLCIHATLKKKRHTIEYAQHQWHIDEFMGEHVPLVIAEIELQNEKEIFTRPAWLGKEVTHCIEYYNTSLIRHKNQNSEKENTLLANENFGI